MADESTPSESKPQEAPTASSGRKWLVAIGIVGVIALLLWCVNFFLVGRPVAQELASDPRNSGYTLRAHYHYYVDPTTLVLDLSEVNSVAPLDLFRGLFQSSKALHDSGRDFQQVILARARKPVFLLTGVDFSSMGRDYGADENPVYMIRTFPEKLHRPDGVAAFGTWEGGLLGVLGKQMEDANEAARQWAEGR